MVNLDTHILVYALNGELTKSEKALLIGEEWSISAIVLWELAKLVELRRIQMDLNSSEVISIINGIHLWPLSLTVCRCSVRLDFKSDPADELIAATSIVHKVPLVTRDKTIRSSKLVPFA